MPANAPRFYVVCYDISGDPRRLTRVHRFLSSRAVPIQYSVFLGFFTADQLDDVLSELREIIDPRRDDVRAYPLPRQPRILGLGRALFPDGVQLVHAGTDLGEWFAEN